MIYKYPDEIEDFVREWSPKMRDQELAAKVNETFGTDFTPGRMKAYRGTASGTTRSSCPRRSTGSIRQNTPRGCMSTSATTPGA